MTSKPWMPLYVADYRADTAHLSAAEHGAYLLLIMHYWQTGSLPKEDAPLARIACMSAVEWRKAKATIASFFSEEWTHKRIEAEIKHAAEISETNSNKAREAANRRWLKHHQDGAQASTEQCSEHAPSINGALLQNAQSQSHTSEPNGSGEAPSDPKTELFARARGVFDRKSAGGLCAKLLKKYGSEDDPRVIAKARARIEEASTKAKPAEWIGRVLAGPERAVSELGNEFPEGIT